MQAVIMAAGKSTRTYPLTITRPKALLPILNKPILAHQLDAFLGIADEVIIITGYLQEAIRSQFGHEYRGLRLKYIEQTDQKGTGHAVLQCASAIREPFLVINGDDLYDPQDLARLAQAPQAALAKIVPDPRLYGIYETTSDHRVIRLVEKPVDVFSNLANIGAYKFTPGVFDVLRHTEPSPRGEIEITSAIQTIAIQEAFYVIETHGYWLPIGYPWHLLDANEYFLEHFLEHQLDGDISPNAHINGRVYVGSGSVIRSGVVIDGPVYIGHNCQIGPNCWLRPGATIGDHCRVGQAVEIKNAILMDHAFAPHLSYIGDSVIGSHSNFGAGTITANVRHDGKTVKSMVKGTLIDSSRRKLGAIVGDSVHTGIHTSIYPGRKLWPGASTTPGQTVREDIITSEDA